MVGFLKCHAKSEEGCGWESHNSLSYQDNGDTIPIFDNYPLVNCYLLTI